MFFSGAFKPSKYKHMKNIELKIKELQNIISKSAARAVLALANRKQGQSYTRSNLWQLSLYHGLVLHLFSNFLNKLQAILRTIEVFRWIYMRCSSESIESFILRLKVFISSFVYMAIDPGITSVVASSSCSVELLLAIFLLPRCHKWKRFFMPLKEFLVHFKTGKNL